MYGKQKILRIFLILKILKLSKILISNINNNIPKEFRKIFLVKCLPSYVYYSNPFTDRTTKRTPNPHTIPIFPCRGNFLNLSAATHFMSHFASSLNSCIYRPALRVQGSMPIQQRIYGVHIYDVSFEMYLVIPSFYATCQKWIYSWNTKYSD